VRLSFLAGFPGRSFTTNTRCGGRPDRGRQRPEADGGIFASSRAITCLIIGFCRVRRPEREGRVEGTVEVCALNYFVPVPQVRDFETINAHLYRKCQEDQERRVRGKAGSRSRCSEEEIGRRSCRCR